MVAAIKKKTNRDDDEPVFDLDALAKAKPGSGRRPDRRLVLPLSELRAAAGATQVELSERSGIPQGEVSKLERRDDLDVVSVGVLRRYIEAIGGKLDVVVRLPNGAAVVVDMRGPQRR